MIVGLTGGIGCGKSTVARFFRVLGYPVYNSDDRARYLQTNDRQIIDQMVDLLGDDILEDGAVNRKRVAAKVFADSDLLDKLNAIVHPRVKADFESWRKVQKAELLIKESALLFETGLYKGCDKLILVRAPEKLRIQRVMQRDGVSEEQVKSRIQRQASDAEKEAVADFVVDNNDRLMIIPQVNEIVGQLIEQEHV